MKTKGYLLALTISFFGTVAKAEQSIDCVRTTDWAETTICDDYTLTGLDEIALRLYEAGVTQRAEVRYFHVLRDNLLRGRKLCQRSKPCIERRYRENISSLAKLMLNGDNIGSAKGYWAVAGTGLFIQDKKGFEGVERSEALTLGMPVDLRSIVGKWWKVKLLTSDFEGWVYASGTMPLPLKFVEYTEEVPTEDTSGDVIASSKGSCPTKIELQEARKELERLKQSMQKMMAENANRTATKSDASDGASSCENIKAQLDAANSALASQTATANAKAADVQSGIAANYVERQTYEAKVKELEALNAAIADLKAQTESETVARAEFEAQGAKLAAANQALADLDAKISTDFVSREDFQQKVSEVEALNNSLADLKAVMEVSYIERSIYEQDVTGLEQQVAALNASLTQQKADADAKLVSQVGTLNSTIVDMQTRTDTLKKRLSEVQTALSSFIEECKTNKECASVMELQQ